MNKRKKLLISVLFSIIALAIFVSVLFIVKAISLLPFILLIVAAVIAIGVVSFFIAKLKRDLKRKQLEKLAADIAPKKDNDDPTAIYKILGIPVRYDKNGRILTLYELLGLVPVYDENGNRVKTIYEELNINPKFDKNGKEIPAIAIIKNRVRKFAKVKDATSLMFTKKLTPEEKELLELRRLLRQKQEQAQQSGDTKKAEAASKAIKNLAKPKAAPKDNFKPIVIGGASAKPIKVDFSESKAAPTVQKFSGFDSENSSDNSEHKNTKTKIELEKEYKFYRDNKEEKASGDSKEVYETEMGNE